MAILLNHTSNLRLRVDLVRRLSDGVRTPASLAFDLAVERYDPAVPGQRDEALFTPLVERKDATLLDLDLIRFLEGLEAILAHVRAQLSGTPLVGTLPVEAALEPTGEPTCYVRVLGGPEAFLVEAGIELSSLLAPIGGERGLPGEDLALFRFPSPPRALLAFSAALLDEFAAFPTDPSLVSPGVAE